MRLTLRHPARALSWFLALWFILTLPIVAAVVINFQARDILLETLAHWRSKVVPLQYVFIGDSLAAGGRNWGWKLWGDPLAVRCLAESSITVWQVKYQARDAITTYHPRVIFVMAGENNLIEGTAEDKTIQDYSDLLDFVLNAHVRPIVTLLPYTDDDGKKELIAHLNLRLRQLCTQKGVTTVDLNPEIAPAGHLLPTFTRDGYHFTAATYSVWAKKLHEALEADPPR